MTTVLVSLRGEAFFFAFKPPAASNSTNTQMIGEFGHVLETDAADTTW
ncbi:hypothetical protein [Tahibacter sp.]|nr:hypothetical protein [Tahibacter sp.]